MSFIHGGIIIHLIELKNLNGKGISTCASFHDVGQRDHDKIRDD